MLFELGESDDHSCGVLEEEKAEQTEGQPYNASSCEKDLSSSHRTPLTMHRGNASISLQSLRWWQVASQKQDAAVSTHQHPTTWFELGEISVRGCSSRMEFVVMFS